MSIKKQESDCVLLVAQMTETFRWILGSLDNILSLFPPTDLWPPLASHQFNRQISFNTQQVYFCLNNVVSFLPILFSRTALISTRDVCVMMTCLIGYLSPISACQVIQVLPEAERLFFKNKSKHNLFVFGKIMHVLFSHLRCIRNYIIK